MFDALGRGAEGIIQRHNMRCVSCKMCARRLSIRHDLHRHAVVLTRSTATPVSIITIPHHRVWPAAPRGHSNIGSLIRTKRMYISSTCTWQHVPGAGSDRRWPHERQHGPDRVLIVPRVCCSRAIAGLLTTWVDRKVTALVQMRVGPPFLQPFYDIRKLLIKETCVPEDGANRSVPAGAITGSRRCHTGIHDPVAHLAGCAGHVYR